MSWLAVPVGLVALLVFCAVRLGGSTDPFFEWPDDPSLPPDDDEEERAWTQDEIDAAFREIRELDEVRA